MIDYVVNKNNPFMRKAKNCFTFNEYDMCCLRCHVEEQANLPEHAVCFTPKTIEWTCSWKRFDDVQRMFAVN